MDSPSASTSERAMVLALRTQFHAYTRQRYNPLVREDRDLPGFLITFTTYGTWLHGEASGGAAA